MSRIFHFWYFVAASEGKVVGRKTLRRKRLLVPSGPSGFTMIHRKARMENHTSQPVPVTGAETHNINLQPEWARVPDITKMFGIKRTSLFRLLADGSIRSASIRRRGSTKGIRIIDCDSVRALLQNQAAKEVK